MIFISISIFIAIIISICASIRVCAGPCYVLIYPLGYAAYVGLNPFYSVPWASPNLAIFLQYSALCSLMSFLALYILTKNAFKKITTWLIFLFLLYDSYWMFTHPRGLMEARSFDALVMCLTVPYLVNSKKLFCKMLAGYFVIVAILLHAKTGLAVAAIGLTVTSIMQGKWVKTILLCTALIAAAGRWVVGQTPTHGNFGSIRERLYALGHYMDWWWVHTNHWVGTGPGSFMVLGPYNVEHKMYVLHNDWIQVLFEYGCVGFSIALSGAMILLYRARNSPVILGSLASFYLASLMYFPLYFIVPQLWLCLQIKELIND